MFLFLRLDAESLEIAANPLVTANGQVTHAILEVTTAKCFLDMQWFPFDTQFCPLNYGSLNLLDVSVNPVHNPTAGKNDAH